MAFLELNWLGPNSILLFWTIIGIMALVVALEAKHLTDISLGFRVMLVGSQLPLFLDSSSAKRSSISCLSYSISKAEDLVLLIGQSRE